MVEALLTGDEDEVESTVDQRLANAHSDSGETLLMKAFRHVAKEAGADRCWVIRFLLNKGADPMVTCDAKKNLFHDFFCQSKPPPSSVLSAMEKAVEMLLEAVGRSNVLCLLLSKDEAGHAPVHCVKPDVQTNWDSIFQTIVSWPTVEQPSKKPRTQYKPVTIGNAAIVNEVLQSLDPQWCALVERLDKAKCSFLLSDAEDPDAIIVVASQGFLGVTGYSREEVLGQNCRFLHGPQTELSKIKQIRIALRDKTSLCVTMTNYRKDGAIFLNCFVLLPLTCNGEVRYFMGIQDCPQDVVDEHCVPSEK